MKKLVFRCELLSDIVLNGSGASEGRLPTLDFIPGSNFLGITARNYNQAKADNLAYELFHTGNVRFGDAHVLLKEKRSCKAPASWQYAKGQSLEDNVWVHHKVSDVTRQKMINGKIQFKQTREGYIAPSDSGGYCYVNVSEWQQFTMKSSYNREERRAAEGQLFGYTAMQPGTVWEFSVCIQHMDADEKLAGFIKKHLCGEQRVGRSRSAQYGRVGISLIGEQEVSDSLEKYAGKIALYAESRLSFPDSYGQPTLRPTPAMLKMPENAEILWDDSQIRISRYAPWNSIRRTRDADRVCIDKGSVLVVKLIEEISLPSSLSGVGIYTNEGFGELQVEPDFLQADENGNLQGKLDILSNKQDAAQSTESTTLSESPLVSWLAGKKKESAANRFTLGNVNKFIENYAIVFDGTFASQWSAIRSLAEQAKTGDDLLDTLFRNNEEDPNKGYLMQGVAVQKWKKKGRRNVLETFLRDISDKDPEILIPLTIKLAAGMAKVVSSQQMESEENV